MFRRKKKTNQPSDAVMAEEIQKSEERLHESRKELAEAKEVGTAFRKIREENHIVLSLREVLNGR